MRPAPASQFFLRSSVVDDLVRDLSIMVEPFDVPAAMAAREAYFRYGKGFHAARLNICDCFACSLAKSCNDSLLFKVDFARPDIIPAWRP